MLCLSLPVSSSRFIGSLSLVLIARSQREERGTAQHPMDNVVSFSLSAVSHPVQSDSRRTLHLVASFPPRVPTGASSWPSVATLEVPDFFIYRTCCLGRAAPSYSAQVFHSLWWNSKSVGNKNRANHMIHEVINRVGENRRRKSNRTVWKRGNQRLGL